MNRHKHNVNKLKPKMHTSPPAKKASIIKLRLAKDSTSEKTLDIADKEELIDIEGILDPNDPNFQSELTYDGYKSIDEYDNDVYNADLERKDHSKRSLTIQGREDDSDMGEENLVDPQENQK